MQDRIILTDCDGVLLDWETPFCDWITQDIKLPLIKKSYNLSEMYGISEAESRSLVGKFNNSLEISRLPPLRDSVEYVQKIHKELGYKFVVITSLGLTPEAIRNREHNLEKYFGDCIADVICLDVDARKDLVLRSYQDSKLWWLEDKIENAVVGKDMGLNSILMRHEYNKFHKGIPMIEDWEEFYNILTCPNSY